MQYFCLIQKGSTFEMKHMSKQLDITLSASVKKIIREGKIFTGMG